MLLFSASASRHFINSIDSKGIRSPGRSNKLFEIMLPLFAYAALSNLCTVDFNILDLRNLTP